MTDAAGVGIEDQEEMSHCDASKGLLSSVLALLADGSFSCDRADPFGSTLLHSAAQQGCRNVALALLRAGAGVDPRNQRKATPIMMAASRGHAEVVELLLHYRAGESDCLPLNRGRYGIRPWRSTALHCAAAGGHVRVVELLLDAGFDRGQHDEAGLTPAEVSARQSHSTSAAITRLVLPTRDMGGKLVHDYVNMAMEDVATVSGLVKGGAFLDWRGGNGDTPLHRAAHFQHIVISKVLLQAGADPNIRGDRLASPLHVAACTGCREIVAALLKAGADMELLSVGGQSPLHMAVANNKVGVIRLLLNAGASTEHRDGILGQTPLSWACELYRPRIVRVLVEAGADVESRSSAGITPLHWACRLNDTESVEVLLNAGADPGAVDQAAADAVAKSSSRSGTIVSMPVAIDVIGLGYPFKEDLSRPFTDDTGMLASRRLALVKVKRIELALRGAKQERSWRRRGWLVILASRRASVEKRGAGGELWAVDHSGCSPIKSGRVDTIVERLPCAHEKEAARHRVGATTTSGSFDSPHSHEELSNRQDGVGKRLRSVDNLVMTAKATSLQQGKTRGDPGGQENVTASLPELVGALLELAAVEVGVFHRVVVFI